MLNEEIMAYMLSHINSDKHPINKQENNVKKDVSMKEAMEIYNEIINVYKSHNVSYQCACKLSLSLNYAFITGAVELYNKE